MAVYRVNKNRGYTVMANYHLRDKTLSLKAVGLLSKMLSFNDGWQQAACHTRLTGSLHGGGTVYREFLSVEMCVCIYKYL